MPLDTDPNARSVDPEPNADTALSEWIRPALPWLLGGVPILVAIIRVLILTRFDPTTLHGVISSLDPLALVIDSAADIVLTLFILAPYVLLVARAMTDRRPRALLIGAAISTVVVVLFAPWVLVVLGLVVGAYWWRTGTFDEVSSESPLRVAGMFLAGALAASLLFSSNLPREVIEWNGDERTIAVVVSDDGQWMTLLHDSDRRVTRIRSGDVDAREICQTRNDTPSLLQAVGVLEPARYPSCVDASRDTP